MSTMVQEKTKTCSKCGQIKGVECFSKNSRKASGLRSECKSCQSGYYAKWTENNPSYKKDWYTANSEKVLARSKKQREENPEAERKRHVKYRQDHPESKRLSEQKRRAAKAGADNDYHTDQQVWDLFGTDCYLCGIQVVKDGQRLPNYNEEHVIAVNNGGDLTLENVRPSCQPCNGSKWTYPLITHLAKREPAPNVSEADVEAYRLECLELDAGVVCVGSVMGFKELLDSRVG